MNKKMLLAAIAASLLFAPACDNANVPANEDNAIEFRTLIDKNVPSRASLVDKTEELTNFFVAGGVAPTAPTPDFEHDLTFLQASVWRSGDSGNYVWNYAPRRYFPADGTRVNFFAYAPVKDGNMGNEAALEINPGDGTVFFNYTVPFDQSESNTSVDLLVANASGDNSSTSAVAFEFNHALSGVTFSARNNNPAVIGAPGSELIYTVSGIEISTLATKGTFTYPFSPSSWDSQADEEIYLPGLPETPVSLMPGGAYVNLLSANDVMMVLPQPTNPGSVTGILETEPSDWSTASYVRVTFSVKYGDGTFMYKDAKLYLPLPSSPSNFEFAPGTLYNFQFQFDASKPVVFDVTELNAWETPTPDPTPLN